MKKQTAVLIMTIVIVLALFIMGRTFFTVPKETEPAPSETSVSPEAMEKSQKQIFAMDTIMSLTAYGENGQKAIEIAESEIYTLQNLLDPQVEDSAIAQVNRNAGTETEIPEIVAKMIQTAKTVNEQSSGALDITVLPIVELWGFLDLDEKEDSEFHAPDPEDIEAALPRLCFDRLQLKENNGVHTVLLPETGAITLGAVAKGCTAQTVLDIMKENGVTSGIVSLGGNVQTLGLKPDGSTWKVAITDPNDPSTYLALLNIGEAAVVTSGTYQRYFTDADTGKTYHHIIDPSTGYPAENGLLSVTIITKDGTLADSLSTAMFVLGIDGATDYWKSYGDKSGQEFDMILINKANEVFITPGIRDTFSLTNTAYNLSFIEP